MEARMNRRQRAFARLLQSTFLLMAPIAMLACGAPANEHGDEEEHEAEAEQITLEAAALEAAGIRVGTAERTTLSSDVSFPGEIQFEPSSTAHVAPMVPGRVVRVDVVIGANVRRGQLLAVVASTDVSAARSGFEQARARLGAAEATLRRQEQLSAEGIGAQRALVQAEAEVAELRAEVDGQRRQLGVLGSGTASSLRLVAPIDGVVVELHGTLGETVSPERAMFVVTDPNRVWVEGHVPERSIAAATMGSSVRVRIAALGERTMNGTITYVSPALDEATRSLPIRVNLSELTPDLRGGLFATIEPVGTAAEGLSIPAAATTMLDGRPVVFVQASTGVFRPQVVVIGRRRSDRVEITSGLAPDTQIALTSAYFLKGVLQRGELAEGHH